ncbi:MAG: hypothetical protein RJA25_559 [Bacteroidota bacterium]|jgi:hypothetical protein
MRFLLLFLFTVTFGYFSQAQDNDDIVLDLDSIKNVKTTRYSSINEVGTSVNVAGTLIQKFPGNTVKRNLKIDKPSVSFRTVHGALINPNFFIGGGVGLDFRPNEYFGTRFFYFTFPFFIEMRQYFLSGNFNLFLSERIGGAVHIDSYYNKYYNKGTYSGAFGEFMIGGRYVTAGKKLAIHFGVGYRMQHLQRKVDVQNLSNTGNIISTYANTPEITIKHYVPITIGVTF